MAQQVLSHCANKVGHGPRELFIVEGISAANAASLARDPASQAVLAVQGKPMNVGRASQKQILANDKLRSIVRTIGAWSGEAFDLDSVQYDRILLLTDGDADGIHASALLLLAFDYLMPELISSGRLEQVRAPLYAIDADQLAELVFAYSAPHRDKIVAKMHEHKMTGIDHGYLQSIAGLDAPELWRACLNPESRVSLTLTRQAAAVARDTLANFGNV